MKKKPVLTFDESPEGVQLHAGISKKTGRPIWHSDNHIDYWSGNWGNRNYRELYKECQTIMRDLLKNHPELAD